MTRTRRSFDFTVSRAEPTDDGLTLEGYAAVFDQPTQIHDQDGEYVETVARGAFKRTINADRTPILQFDHGTHPLIGSIPLGSIRKLEEDDNGLFVRARLSDNWLVQPVRDAIADGAITGMSFQFEVLQGEWSKDRSERTIREVKLYELGPVVWPAYKQTSVGVRSEISNALACPDLRADFARAVCFPSSVESEPAIRTSDETSDNPPVPALVVDKKAVAAQASRVAAAEALGSEQLSKGK